MKTEITSFSSSFFEYLCGFVWFDQDKLQALMKRYPIGATEQYEPIFWHINAENKITNGHIITMDDKTGKIFDDDWYYQDGRPMCLFGDRKSTRLNSSHANISYAVFCLNKKKHHIQY